MTWTVKFNAKVVPEFLPDAHLARAVKILGICGRSRLDSCAACEKWVQKTLGCQSECCALAALLLDVTHPQANKGTVLAHPVQASKRSACTDRRIWRHAE